MSNINSLDEFDSVTTSGGLLGLSGISKISSLFVDVSTGTTVSESVDSATLFNISCVNEIQKSSSD